MDDVWFISFKSSPCINLEVGRKLGPKLQHFLINFWMCSSIKPFFGKGEVANLSSLRIIIKSWSLMSGHGYLPVSVCGQMLDLELDMTLGTYFKHNWAKRVHIAVNGRFGIRLYCSFWRLPTYITMWTRSEASNVIFELRNTKIAEVGTSIFDENVVLYSSSLVKVSRIEEGIISNYRPKIAVYKSWCAIMHYHSILSVFCALYWKV